MLWASPPDDGADADGRLLVDVTEFVLLVTEFLLSFVGTLAGLKLSSDIAFQLFGASCFVTMHGCGRLEGFQSVSAKLFQRGYLSVLAAAAARAGSASAAGLFQRVQEPTASLIRAANRLDRL